MATVQCGTETSIKPSDKGAWANIASLNISKRKKTNTLEVRLENETGTGCSLNVEEIERLLRRLRISSNQFSMVQACPERKNVVYITFAPGVDISKFTTFQSESFILKDGIRTTSIRPVGNREVSVTVFGLHPDTRDEAVVEYLNAHGKVNKKDPIIYGVYPGEPGSSLLAGKQNGSRSYMMEVKKNLGTYHIIDGEKVTIKYRGQIKTCAKCHQNQSICPGKGLARDCTADRILLSDHMRQHWQEINFNPSSTEMNDVDILTDEELEKVSDHSSKKPELVFKEPAADILEKCTGIVIPGIKKDCDISDFLDCLKACGLPEQYGLEDFHFKENRRSKTVTIHDLDPKKSLEIMKNLQGKVFSGRKVTAYTLIEDTPQKKTSIVKTSDNKSSSEKSDSDSTDDEYDTSYEHNDNLNSYIFKTIDSFKRKAELSPAEPVVLSKKERKRQKKLNSSK